MRQWIYHETESPRAVNVNDAWGEGWSDCPVIHLPDCGIDPDDVFAVQAFGETVTGIQNCLNGLLNLREMKIGQLKQFAKKHYGRTIKGNKPLLIAQIEALNSDDTKRLH